MDEEKKEQFFETEESFISWISAYYPAPSKFESAEERKKNASTWERFFDNMRIATGEELKYSKKYNHVMNESRKVLTQNDSEGITGTVF